MPEVCILIPGIIDEHSHIAGTGNINECSQSVTAEVGIWDIINPDDINIYRQPSGGGHLQHMDLVYHTGGQHSH